MESEPRKGKPIVRWGRKVMDLRVKHGHYRPRHYLPDRQAAEGFFFGSFFYFEQGGAKLLSENILLS